jgi:hypothetical protein
VAWAVWWDLLWVTISGDGIGKTRGGGMEGHNGRELGLKGGGRYKLN